MIFHRILDCSVLAIAALFILGMLAYEYKLWGLAEPAVPISNEWKFFFDMLIFPLATLLTVDLVLKYKTSKNPKEFIRKYWIDIVMLAAIPVFSVFKFLKIGLSVAKQAKTAKMGAKIAHKTKKMSKWKS